MLWPIKNNITSTDIGFLLEMNTVNILHLILFKFVGNGKANYNYQKKLFYIVLILSISNKAKQNLMQNVDFVQFQQDSIISVQSFQIRQFNEIQLPNYTRPTALGNPKFRILTPAKHEIILSIIQMP